jgi:transglutaminase-like putative cysteine protease
VKYRLEYDTRLVFSAPVREHHCELRLVPAENEVQRLLAVELSTEPKSEVHSYADCFGNRVDFFAVMPPHSHLHVRLVAEVETLLANPFGFAAVPPPQERRWLEAEMARQPRLLDYVLHRSALTPAVDATGSFFTDAPVPAEAGKPLLEAVVAARDWLTDRLAYEAEAPGQRLPLEKCLAAGVGDACDFAHALIALVRSWGVPARYVRGYQEASDDADEGEAAEHAWAEVLIPGAGWRGFDAVNRLLVNDVYVAVAVGRDADDVPPLKRVCQGEGAAEASEVRQQVRREKAGSGQEQSQ